MNAPYGKVDGVPDLIPVASSNVSGIGYDAKAQRLWIDFGGPHVYSFEPFTSDEWDDFRAAKSPGQHFHAKIKKNAAYRGNKIAKPVLPKS